MISQPILIKRLQLSLAYLLGLSACLIPHLANATTDDHFADNGFGKPVSTMQHPCAEHYNSVTYIAYQGIHEDPYVCSYNHTTKTWLGPFKAGTSALGKMPKATNANAIDNHGRPALVIDRQGYIHLVFGGHGGSWFYGKNLLGTPGSGKQIHIVSENPGDIASWKVVDNITPFGTYSQFVKMPDGDIYLFYRHGSHRSDWVFQKSSDDCRTFTSPVSILKHQPQADDPDTYDSWYAWFSPGHGDTIAMTFNHHPCSTINHSSARNNGYFMTMNCSDDSWHNVEGNPVDLPVTKKIADQLTLVCNTGNEGLRTGICHMDTNGHPHVFFRQGGGQIRYYRWTGNAWQAPVVVSQQSKSQDGDFLIDSPTDIRMLLSQTISGKEDLSWWSSKNGGLNWSKGNTLMAADNSELIISAIVRNAHPDARIVVSEIDPDKSTMTRKMFLLGDHGPVKRTPSPESK